MPPLKKLLLTSTLFGATTLTSQADITVFSEYHLGEDGVAERPQDGSGNGVHFTSGAGTTQGSVGTTDLSPAPVTTAVLRTDEGQTTIFAADFSTLPTDDFAVGIYARSAGGAGHVLTLGNTAGSLRISLEAEGWVANFAPAAPDPAILIGDAGVFTADTWVHLAVIRKAGETTFYVDGVAQGLPETLTVPVHTNNGHLAVDPGGARRVQGMLDEMRVVTFEAADLPADIITALQGIDSDGDGLLDTFEQRIIDADAGDAFATLADVLPGDDFDGDVGTNLAEMNQATDPTDPLDIPVLDADGDGLADVFEQLIIDADAADAFATFADVLPGDDFDNDLYTNAEEQNFETDPTDPLSPSAVSVDLEMLGFWDFNDAAPGATTTTDRVDDYPGDLVPGTMFTPDMGGRSGGVGDYAMDFGNDPAGGLGVNVTDTNFLDAVNESTANDRLSVSFWQKLVATGDASSFNFFSAGAANGGRGFHGHIPWSNGTVFFTHESPLGRDRPTTSGAATDWLQWVHIAAVKGRGVKSFWINGVRVINNTNVWPGMREMSLLSIGSGVNNGNAIQGAIDDFAVFNDELTEAQILELAGGASPFSLVGGEPSFEITDISRTGDIVSLTWDSEVGKTYTVRYSFDLVEWDADFADGVNADAGDSTTMMIDLSVDGLETVEELFFRIELE